MYDKIHYKLKKKERKKERKDPNAGKDWKQEEKGIAEDEVVGWHHQLDAHEI